MCDYVVKSIKFQFFPDTTFIATGWLFLSRACWKVVFSKPVKYGCKYRTTGFGVVRLCEREVRTCCHFNHTEGMKRILQQRQRRQQLEAAIVQWPSACSPTAAMHVGWYVTFNNDYLSITSVEAKQPLRSGIPMATPTMGHMNLCARERLLHPTTFWCKRFQKLCSVLLHAKRVNSLGECGFSFGHLCGEREALAYNLHIDRLADTSNPPHRFASLWFRPLCLPLT